MGAINSVTGLPKASFGCALFAIIGSLRTCGALNYFFAESINFCRSTVIAVGSRAAAYTFTIRPAASKPRADKAAIRTVRKNFFGF